MHPLLRLAEQTAAHLDHVRPTDADRSLRDGFVAELRSLSDPAPNSNSTSGHPVRGLRHAPTVLASVSASTTLPEGLRRSVLAAFGHVRWSEFYAPDAWSDAFLSEFANGEGIGPDGALVSDRMILGLFVLGPNTLYPAHAHPAEEFYLTLSGTPSFQIGASEPFAPLPPGAVAWHHSNVSHAIRTGPEPFLAAFGWRAPIGERSWYRDDMADLSLPFRYPTIAKE